MKQKLNRDELKDILEQIFAYDKAFPGMGVQVMLDSLMGNKLGICVDGKMIDINKSSEYDICIKDYKPTPNQ